MNKTTKKNKVDKCPSTLENKVKDVHSNLTSNEKSQELMELNNGLTNGIGLNDEITTEKGSRKNKKNKYKNGGHVDLRNDHLSDGTCITKTVSTDARNIDQSSESKKNKLKSDNTVNSVNSNFKGNTKAEIGSLDSNDDNCCDENTSCGPLIETIGINQAVSSSSKTIHNSDCDPKPNELKLEITESSLLEVSETLKDIHLGNESEVKETIETKPVIHFKQYESELQMPMIMKIIQKDLSEPYSIYTYRYFIHNWPKLCFLAMCEDECVGAIVCKLDVHRKVIKRGYIAMLAVDQNYRKLRIGSNLVQMAINEMIQGDADEVVLETEVTNKPALQLYEKLGFVRDKRLFRYYLNGVDALRLKLWLR